jgi:hypothetical protein
MCGTACIRRGSVGKRLYPPAPPAPVENRPLPKAKPKQASTKKPRETEDDDVDVELYPPVRPEDMPDDDDKAPPTAQELKRARIFELAQLMAAGEWKPKMAKRFAELWSVSVKTVQHYTAEASRLLDLTTNQRATLVAITRVRLLQVLHENETDRVQAARTLLENLGELRQQHVHQVADPFEGWTEAEITAYADKGQRPERFGRKRAAQ